MSTVQKINFEPVSDIMPVQRRDFPLADKTLADPLNAVALVDGEWMTLNSSYQLVRAADIATLGTAGAGGRALVRSFPLWAERGRTDVRAMSLVKMPILWRGDYEFDTRIFDASAIVASGLAITTIMQPLKVATVAIGARNYVGLVGSQISDSGVPVVGLVTKLPANNGGKLRFVSAWRF
jgi:hypothetical protein